MPVVDHVFRCVEVAEFLRITEGGGINELV